LPYRTTFVHDGRGVLHVGSGVVTGEEILGGDEEIQSDPDRAARIDHGLVDFTDVTELRVSSADLRLIADASRATARLVPEAIVAIVAPRAEAFEIARMWELIANVPGWRTHVFRDRASAEAWMRGELGDRATDLGTG
jgi:hypothetical protein